MTPEQKAALLAIIGAQWAVMITVADWCEAFGIDPERDKSASIVNGQRWGATGGMWVVFMNLGHLPCAADVVRPPKKTVFYPPYVD